MRETILHIQTHTIYDDTTTFTLHEYFPMLQTTKRYTRRDFLHTLKIIHMVDSYSCKMMTGHSNFFLF